MAEDTIYLKIENNSRWGVDHLEQTRVQRMVRLKLKTNQYSNQ